MQRRHLGAESKERDYSFTQTWLFLTSGTYCDLFLPEMFLILAIPATLHLNKGASWDVQRTIEVTKRQEIDRITSYELDKIWVSVSQPFSFFDLPSDV